MNNRDYDTSALDNFEDHFKTLIGKSLLEIGKETIKNVEKSFRTRSFDNKAWDSTLFHSNSKGGIVHSLKIQPIGPFEIAITSNLPYANIQNDGGRVHKTKKMIKFFFAKYYETNDKRWLNLAISKKRYITIEARPFLRDNEEFRTMVGDIISKNLKQD